MPIEPTAEPHAGAADVPTLGKAPAGAATPQLALEAANGWRGIGALAIAFGHLALEVNTLYSELFFPVSLFVDLFFVLSGLVIAQAYSAKLSRASNFPEYMVRRFGRIWPVQAAMLTLFVVYECAKMAVEALTGFRFAVTPFSPEGHNLLQAIPTNLLLIQSLGIHDRETWNFPSWSLSVEFVTYIAFAGFCLVRPAVRRALSIITIVASLAILVRYAPAGMRSTYDFGIFRCFAGFFAGTLCYEAAARWSSARPPFPTLFEISTVVFTIAWLEFGIGTVADYAGPLVCTFFVFVFVIGQGLLSRLLETKPLQMLAELSFSIYMVHSLVLIGLLTALHALARVFRLSIFVMEQDPLAARFGQRHTVEMLHVGTFPSAIITTIYMATVLAAAVPVYRLVEVPGRRFFARLAKRVATLVMANPGGREALGGMGRVP